MMFLFVVVAAVLILGMYWFKTYCDRIEDDSSGMVDANSREPYGTKWISLATFRRED